MLEQLKNGVKGGLRQLPYLNYIFARYDELTSENENLRAELQTYRTWMPPGHFYSPIHDMAEVEAQAAHLFDRTPRPLAAVDLREPAQMTLLADLLPYYQDQPFSAKPQPDLRYHLINPYFYHGDAILLYCLIRHMQPRRIIEVGCGYSSCLLMDTNERYFQDRIQITHIDPRPEVVMGLLHPGDWEKMDFRPEKLQAVPLTFFDELAAGDILFIDSTHVAKVGSDVNHLFFHLLPRLKPGVLIHLHDIFYPFEYPQEWLAEGRAWNEAYLLRAFLQYNAQFQVLLFGSFLASAQSDWLAEHMPLCLRAELSSIWLEHRGEKP